ncbi:hypothetical protein J0910_02070 [Nocardiopsis sp. CNT-189]|uniref:hypothetical protein n=1 Tax=Nocardiopsis oceanisediminis TaxID=2816862 RepID=UPI003B39DA58
MVGVESKKELFIFVADVLQPAVMRLDDGRALLAHGPTVAREELVKHAERLLTHEEFEVFRAGEAVPAPPEITALFPHLALAENPAT